MSSYLRIFLGVVFLFSWSLDSLASECSSLVANKCSGCHFTQKLCPMLEKGKGSWAWKRSVRSMKEFGAAYTKQEEKQLVKCLSNPDEHVRAICSGSSAKP
ncbi:hypothetical protein [Desulfogranum japonicum]|uniref:hypothetical protein n=1 Tax=Desulfogranum japonicum TaxID=231447 RepID=UPI0003FFCD32|nr:hypothetical protein [Desulfogranum japonicum]